MDEAEIQRRRAMYFKHLQHLERVEDARNHCERVLATSRNPLKRTYMRLLLKLHPWSKRAAEHNAAWSRERAAATWGPDDR